MSDRFYAIWMKPAVVGSTLTVQASNGRSVSMGKITAFSNDTSDGLGRGIHTDCGTVWSRAMDDGTVQTYYNKKSSVSRPCTISSCMSDTVCIAWWEAKVNKTTKATKKQNRMTVTV
jgi:hypothetical protein